MTQEDQKDDVTLSQFLDAVAGGTATPGGGSVSALAGTLAAALVEMVVNLTRGKKGFEAQQAEMEKLGAEARSYQSLRRRLTSILRWPALLLIAALLCGWISLGPLARGFIEKSLCRTLETTVSVEDIELGIVSGSSRLNRISVENPPGFQLPALLVLQDLRWSLPLTALTDDEIDIESLAIQQVVGVPVGFTDAHRVTG